MNIANAVLISSGHFEEEEKKRKVMGLSAFAKCQVLAEIVESVGSHENACEVVANKLTSEWNNDTVKRYVSVAKKLQSMPLLMNQIVQMEYDHGRDSAIDGITALRSLTSLNLEEVDAVYVVTRLKCLFLFFCWSLPCPPLVLEVSLIR